MKVSSQEPASVAPLRLPRRARLSRFASILALLPGAVPCVVALGILVPAYFSPTSGGYWSALNQAADRVPLIAIMNPSNGPSTSVNSNYTSAVNALRSAGGRVIGYVYSSYTARPLVDVKADIDRYHAFYTIDGFFVDEMTNDSDATHLAYYEELYQYIKAKRSSYLVVGNPGINTTASYLTRPTVDALVTFENNTGYPQYTPDPWTQTQPATAFSHLCYDVPTADTMTVLGIRLETNRTVQVGVLGTPGKYVLQASNDLTNWEGTATNVSPTGKFNFSDPGATNHPTRAYRTAQ